MNTVKSTILWILSIFFGLSSLVFFPSAFCLFAIPVTALLIPIPKWQRILSRFIKGKLKKVIVIALAIVCVYTAPTTEVDSPTPIDSAASTTTEYATEAATEADHTLSTEAIEEVIHIDDSAEESPTEANSELSIELDDETNSETNSESTITEIPETADVPTSETYITDVTEPVHTHNFSPATCTTPGICSCGATEGEATGHNWQTATCSDPQTCLICAETVGYATGHYFYNGTCTNCQTPDPNYTSYETSEAMVWIPTKGGAKYHTHSSCSGMEGPEYVTRSQAEARGFTPCKKCY